MLNKKKRQVTIIVDKKQNALGERLLGMISEKGYIVNKVTPKTYEENTMISSENKVIHLAPSKLYDDVRKFNEPQYSKFGMEYGWHGNTCFIGVDSKKFKLEDKDEIVNLFPKNVKSEVQNQENNMIKKKSKFQKKGNVAGAYIDGILASAASKVTVVTSSVLSGPLPLLSIGGYYTFRKVSEYKNKAELKEHMELANIQNFVGTGLDEFMEKE